MQHLFSSTYLKNPLTLLFLFTLSYYSFRSCQIGKHNWKFAEGDSILGDLSDLDYKIFTLFNDNVYRNGALVGRIQSYNYRVFNHTLVIESADGEYYGVYSGK